MPLRNAARFAVTMLVASGAAGACGGSTTTPSDDGGASDAAPKADAAPAPPCPAAKPTANAACTKKGLVCEYGTDPRHSCNALATCSDSAATAGKWILSEPKCPELLPVACPASRAAAQGQKCSPEGGICVFEEGLSCTCTSCPNPYPVCQTTPTPVWACQAPNANPDCLPARPNLGTPCSKEGAKCAYGCERQNNLVCSAGAWSLDSQLGGGCPISTRRAKRDIRYLSSSESQALAGEVQNIRLATYEYTDPALAGGRHLGFILEDHATTFAGDSERNQVDLYAYTSTLVAAIQEQAKDIEALKREVEYLRAHRK